MTTGTYAIAYGWYSGTIIGVDNDFVLIQDYSGFVMAVCHCDVVVVEY